MWENSMKKSPNFSKKKQHKSRKIGSIKQTNKPMICLSVVHLHDAYVGRKQNNKAKLI